MAIRIRKVKNKNATGGFSYVVLCAAKNKSKKGDIYLDDSIDHALRMKFLDDYEEDLGVYRKQIERLYTLELAPFRGYYESLLKKENCGK